MSNFPRAVQDLLYGRQYHRILRLSFPHDDGPSAELLVNKLDAAESLSRDFEFIVELLSDDASIPLKAMQGRLLNIELVRRDGTLRYFSGHVFSFRRCRSDGGVTFYEAKLGPWLKFLSLRKDSYLFHGKTLREQTASIFADYSVYPKWRVSGDDPAMTNACQFDETDFNYLSRRWEAAGWYYTYEHDADGHKLVIRSDTTQARMIDSGLQVRFHGAGGALEEDAIDRWSPVRHVMAASVALSSFDFKDPMPASAGLPTVNKQGDVAQTEFYEYVGAYGFTDFRNGGAKSRTRIEEIEAIARYVEAEGNNRYMVPGRWFQLVDHFNHNIFGRGREPGKDDFLILSVRHIATNNYLQEADKKVLYRNELTCMRRDPRTPDGDRRRSFRPRQHSYR